jgi:hypothetical protein
MPLSSNFSNQRGFSENAPVPGTSIPLQYFDRWFNVPDSLMGLNDFGDRVKMGKIDYRAGFPSREEAQRAVSGRKRELLANALYNWSLGD